MASINQLRRIQPNKITLNYKSNDSNTLYTHTALGNNQIETILNSDMSSCQLWHLNSDLSTLF